MTTTLLDLARQVLRSAGYLVASTEDRHRSFQFEDEAVLGSLHTFDDITALLETWEAEQDSFLKRSAKALRAEPTKAWNVYTVLLCSQACPDELRSKLDEIEENFRGTRKIARAKLQTLEDVRSALLPLLPLQSVAVLKLEDPIKRLRGRLGSHERRVVDGLVGEVAPDVLAAWLVEGR